MMLQPLKVAVLTGGANSEREVSLASGKAVMTALAGLGHQASAFDVTPDLAAQLLDFAPDVVFNALHGRGVEDGTVQGFLEILKLPYTHSDVKASAVAMDKKLTKQALAHTDIDFAADRIVTASHLYEGDPFARPYVLKALDEGSSVSVVIITDDAYPNPLNPSADADGPWATYANLLAEEFIPGQEISVAVLGGKALGTIELRPHEGFYDYRAKYTDGVTDHIVPADIPAEAQAKAMADAVVAHEVLGCSGVTRSDFRYDPGTRRVVFLEINTQPGMTELSLVPEIAAHAGLSFPDLITALIDEARERP
ncbi:MAG: D-alanine--D-alanine ligase [Pseudomonadota bacterium]